MYPPKNTQELQQRAHQIAGLTFQELVAYLNQNNTTRKKLILPQDLKRNKGWVGQLIEVALGACAGSRAEPDFPHLGIELKTIPINRQGAPLETTFVCVAPLTGLQGVTWEKSHIRQKLNLVLWVPIEGERKIPLAERHIGTAFLWRPSTAQEKILKQDWEEIMDKIALGEIEEITARTGQYLQLRPKAANNKALTPAYGKEGAPILTLPRGFYLKKTLTKKILHENFF